MYSPGIWSADDVMPSFSSGVPYSFFFPFNEASTLGSIVLRYTYAPTAIRRVSSFFSLFRFIGGIAFFDYVCTIITILSLYGEYVVRSPLPNVVILHQLIIM